MELFIRIKDGQPFEHPILGDNFRQVFPDVDVNNLPPEFAHFVRVEPPVVGVYENYTGVTYEFIDGVYKDVHHVEPMTEQQKLEKQNAVKASWVDTELHSWVFNDENCCFVPPVAYPTDGKFYRWDEPTISWVEVTNV